MTRPATVAELDRELALQAAQAQEALAAAQAETADALRERDRARANADEVQQQLASRTQQLVEAHEQLAAARDQIFWLEKLHVTRLIARPRGRIARAAQAMLRSQRPP